MATRAEIDAAIANGSDVDKADLRDILKDGVQDDFLDVASASTVDIGAEASRALRITGTTTITALGTATAGTWRWLRFAAALTFTHHATSLILPGGASISTVAGDRALMWSLGAGNWICLCYQSATTDQMQTVSGATTTGKAVYVAANSAAARSAISVPAYPTETASAVGEWKRIASSVGGDLDLPSGGTWAWLSLSINNSAGTYAAGDAGVDAGGTTIAAASAGVLHTALAWRVA